MISRFVKTNRTNMMLRTKGLVLQKTAWARNEQGYFLLGTENVKH